MTRKVTFKEAREHSMEVLHDADKRREQAALAAPMGSAVGGDFYKGIEWFACWLLDNAEGETITEEQLRPWAAKAWTEHLKRQNVCVSDGPADAHKSTSSAEGPFAARNG